MRSIFPGVTIAESYIIESLREFPLKSNDEETLFAAREKLFGRG